MRVILVEPDYHVRRRDHPRHENGSTSKRVKARLNDDTLWYPPLGLMKLATFHKQRGDQVRFVRGLDKELTKDPDLFEPLWWDRVYITTLFTYAWDVTVKTIEFYKMAVGRSIHKVFVGGIMATLMADEIFDETGIYPITGILMSPGQIGLDGNERIDLLAPDYDILDNQLYGVNETLYAYTTRGCKNKCRWCGVPLLEPKFIPYIDIKPVIRQLRDQYGDKPKLKLMDNNVLASPELARIVGDLLQLGYGKECYTDEKPKRKRVVDFNQGVDARLLTNDVMEILSPLNIKPMRIAFDRFNDKESYLRAVKTASIFGVSDFSNYMLYNCDDSPRDLYERLVINTKLNEEWRSKDCGISIYSYPMRYAPIKASVGEQENRMRDYTPPVTDKERDYLKEARWTKRFIRNIEVMKSAAHGCISPTPSLARRTLGSSYEEYIANLYMPEFLLRNRNRFEARVYKHEPQRKPGTGEIEEFREFILVLLERQDDRFLMFHEAVSERSALRIKECIDTCGDDEMKRWLTYYLMK